MVLIIFCFNICGGEHCLECRVYVNSLGYSWLFSFFISIYGYIELTFSIQYLSVFEKKQYFSHKRGKNLNLLTEIYSLTFCRPMDQPMGGSNSKRINLIEKLSIVGPTVDQESLCNKSNINVCHLSSTCHTLKKVGNVQISYG